MVDERYNFRENDLHAPLKLATSRVWRTGRGGRELDKLLGEERPSDTHFSEDWVMSTSQARNIGREDFVNEGLSYLANGGVSLKSIIDTYPVETLGQSHFEQVGKAPGVLAKIVDPVERTTLQVHPDKETALRLFNSSFGKTESWHVLSVRSDVSEQPGVYLGFKEGITRERWKQIFDEQDIPAMLGCLHYFPVKLGDTFIIKAGVPHAVSGGFMFYEAQEPTDFTIRTERFSSSGFRIDDYMCHQGLGFDRMFDCFKYDGLSKEEAAKQYIVPRKTLSQTSDYTRYEVVGYDHTDCFKLQRYEINTRCVIEAEPICSGLLVMSGDGTMACNGTEQGLSPGDRYFISACCNPVTLHSSGNEPLLVFRCYGPQLK